MRVAGTFIMGLASAVTEWLAVGSLSPEGSETVVDAMGAAVICGMNMRGIEAAVLCEGRAPPSRCGEAASIPGCARCEDALFS